MKFIIDLKEQIKPDEEYGGYTIPIKLKNSKCNFTQGDCYGDLIAIDVDSQSLWFRDAIYSVLQAGWKDEEYIELSEFLTYNFGSGMDSAICGKLRRHFL